MISENRQANRDHLGTLIKEQLKIQYPNEPTEFHRAFQKAQIKSEGEEGLWWQITHVSKIQFPMREVRLVEGREWRCDFVWFHPRKLMVEIEGGIWTNGRHNRPKGFKEDMKKYNAIVKLGFTLLRFSPEDVDDGKALMKIEEFFKGEL